jgi:uncharacterized delta-60 repeat protein
VIRLAPRPLTDLTGQRDEAAAVISDPDGRLVLTGVAGDAPERIALVRYDADGALDSTFGTDGVAVSSAGSTDDRAVAATVQGDGKIVVAGTIGGFGHSDFALARYDAGGALDPSFGVGGKVDLAVTRQDAAVGVVQQSSGDPSDGAALPVCKSLGHVHATETQYAPCCPISSRPEQVKESAAHERQEGGLRRGDAQGVQDAADMLRCEDMGARCDRVVGDINEEEKWLTGGVRRRRGGRRCGAFQGRGGMFWRGVAQPYSRP